MLHRSVNTTGGKQEGSKMADSKYQLLLKYKKQTRFLLGTCSRLLLDKTVEGQLADLKEYKNRWVCMYKEILMHRQTKRIRVKALCGDGAS